MEDNELTLSDWVFDEDAETKNRAVFVCRTYANDLVDMLRTEQRSKLDLVEFFYNLYGMAEFGTHICTTRLRLTIITSIVIKVINGL